MENFSASSLEEGPSRRRSLRKRRDHQRRLNLIDESSEEEEETFKVNDYEEDQDDFEECHEEDEAVAGNVGKRKVEEPFLNGSVSWRVSDPDVLDCPVCYELLTIPVFQCENGHVACSTCCASAKLKNKCPFCSFRIGFKRCRAIERVVESVKVLSQYKKNGAK